MAKGGLGKGGLVKVLGVLLEEAEGLPWEERRLVSIDIVERVAKFAEHWGRENRVRERDNALRASTARRAATKTERKVTRKSARQGSTKRVREASPMP